MKSSDPPFMEWPYLIAFIAFLIMTIVGILIIIYSSSPPQLLSLGEILSLGGLIGSWGTVILSATQRQVIDFRREMRDFRREMLDSSAESLTLLKEIRDLLRR